MKKKTNQSTMNKIVSGLIGGLILWSILNFVVKPLIKGDKNNNNSREYINNFKKKYMTEEQTPTERASTERKRVVEKIIKDIEEGKIIISTKEEDTTTNSDHLNNQKVYSCALKDANNIDTAEWTISTNAISKVGMVVGSGKYLVENSCCPEKGQRLGIYDKDAKLKWFDLNDENLYLNLIETSVDKIKHKKFSLKIEPTEIERFNKLFNGAENAKKGYNSDLVSVNSYISEEEKFFYSAKASFKNNDNSISVFDVDCK